MRISPSVLSKLPLNGVKVLDLSRVLAGPHAAQILGDMGADVVKVEHPMRGDDTRSWGPPFAAGGESAYYLAANRNKRSIGINFQQPEGQALVKKLALRSDILIENYLPNGLSKYGLGYQDLQKINPKLVYASITGYGQTGPYRNRPGYDVMVEAEFGLMHITGYPDTPPAKVGVAITDLTTGLYGVISILGALRHAERYGEGQHLDISLADCQLASLANIGSNVLVSGKPDSGRQGDSHPSICPYQSFPTRDGRIMIGGGNDKLFGLIATELGHSEWNVDPKFATNSQRVQNRSELVHKISEITKTKTTKEWETQWENRGFPYAPINDVKTALEHEHSVARKTVSEVTHPQIGSLKMVDHPVKWSKTQPSIRAAPPLLGQHTSEVLSELGLSQAKIDQLRKDNIV